MIWNKQIKKRILGLYGDMLSPNLIIALAGVHGNEPAGIHAIKKVLKYLQDNAIVIQGCFLGLKGNIKACELNQRFIDTDLNRLWSQEQIDRIRQQNPEKFQSHEELEQQELLHLLEQFISHREASDPFVFIDLHTTSAKNGLFTIVNENEKALDLAQSLPVPVIQGLTRVLEHTTLDMFSDKKFAALAFEAGQHQEEESIERMVAFILLSMFRYNMIVLNETEIERFTLLLEKATGNLPRKTQFIYRHKIEAKDNFQMLEGFKNFDSIANQQILAIDSKGHVLSPSDGYILMPLYQKQGSDGFFIIK